MTMMTIINTLVFSNEVTFHLPRQDYWQHTLWTQDSENPHERSEHKRDSPKVNVFATMSREKQYAPYFVESTLTWSATPTRYMH